MKIGKQQVKTIMSALEAAILWDDSLIDAYRVKWARRNGECVRIVPSESRPTVNSIERRVRKYRRLSLVIRKALNE